MFTEFSIVSEVPAVNAAEKTCCDWYVSVALAVLAWVPVMVAFGLLIYTSQ